MNESNGYEDPLDEVLAEYKLRIDCGERIDRQEMLETHPEIADELRKYFAVSDAFAEAFMETPRRSG
jgi:hypothetical protein